MPPFARVSNGSLDRERVCVDLSLSAINLAYLMIHADDLSDLLWESILMSAI
jgi:hypothetical protein